MSCCTVQARVSIFGRSLVGGNGGEVNKEWTFWGLYRERGGQRGKEIRIGSIVRTEVDSVVNCSTLDVGSCVM